MSNYFLQYCALISSQAQLDYCRAASSVAELLACIKKLWECPTVSDDDLLREIFLLNQTPINSQEVTLAGRWLPYRYQPQQRIVNWLLPTGHATEPFQDETICRYRQLLLNQIIQPCTSLTVAQQQAKQLVDTQPAGFIFHLSRCGSTLISACLSELETTCVFSESPLLTELLLDDSLPAVEQQDFLRCFINLQGAAFSERPQIIIKWNAWDIFRWKTIRTIYPDVPAIFLVRDPIEILASHQRSSGRHMAGDPTLAKLHPVFANRHSDGSWLDWQIQVLRSLLLAMSEKSTLAKVMVVDYQYWDEQSLTLVLDFFGCGLNEHGFLKIQERMRFHSKSPGQVFVPDKEKKRNCFTSAEQARIHTQLAFAYNQLNKSAQKNLGMVINVY